MTFAPDSTVRLLDVPLDNKYKNQLRFSTVEAQTSYFVDKTIYACEGVTYQRKDNVIRYLGRIDNLWKCNYVMYLNNNYSNKWFYAFITKMEYVSENVTDIYIETDVYQTWLFDVDIMASFVIREHVANDGIGTHLVDEGLEYGEYKMTEYAPVGEMGDNWNVLAVSDATPLGNGAQVGEMYGNVMTGLIYYPFPNTTEGRTWLKDTIHAYDLAGKQDAIVMIFTVPQLCLVFGGGWVLGDPLPSGQTFGVHEVTIPKRLTTVDGYAPKNAKLHTYPYKFAYLSNNTGQSAHYRYEDFSDVDMNFLVEGAVSPNPTIIMTPENYRGTGLMYEYGLSLSGYPLCSWNSDTYTAWLAQNGLSTGVAVAGATVAVIGGTLSGNIPALAGGILGLFSQVAQMSKASIQPDQARGQVGNGSIHFADGSLDFYYAHMSIKSSYAKKIDDFLTMYGYKVNALKIPETHSRQNWNFILTHDINITGSIPADDMRKLKSIYDEGITLWHNPANFLNYSLTNSII